MRCPCPRRRFVSWLYCQRPSDASTFNGHAADNNAVPAATYHPPIPPAQLNSLSAHVATTTAAEDTSETCGNIQHH